MIYNIYILKRLIRDIIQYNMHRPVNRTDSGLAMQEPETAGKTNQGCSVKKMMPRKNGRSDGRSG